MVTFVVRPPLEVGGLVVVGRPWRLTWDGKVNNITLSGSCSFAATHEVQAELTEIFHVVRNNLKEGLLLLGDWIEDHRVNHWYDPEYGRKSFSTMAKYNATVVIDDSLITKGLEAYENHN